MNGTFYHIEYVFGPTTFLPLYFNPDIENSRKNGTTDWRLIHGVVRTAHANTAENLIIEGQHPRRTFRVVQVQIRDGLICHTNEINRFKNGKPTTIPQAA